MAKRRTISYRNTAILSITGGIISVAGVMIDSFTRATETDLGIAGTVIGAAAIIAWFLGAAAGLLALSTEYKRTAVAGLVLCGIALLIFVLAPTLIGA